MNDKLRVFFTIHNDMTCMNEHNIDTPTC